MKKSLKMLLSLVAACALGSQVFAGPLGSLGKSLLASDEAKPASGTIPSETELLPVIWNYLYAKPSDGDKSVRQIKKIRQA